MAPVNSVRIEDWAAIPELVLMSIGTDKGSWWADPDFGSELRKLRQTGKVDNRTAGTVQKMIDACLAWIKEDGLAGNISCTAERTGKNEIAYTVTVVRQLGDPLVIKDTWYAL
jgi:phage gp46-like protein